MRLNLKTLFGLSLVGGVIIFNCCAFRSGFRMNNSSSECILDVEIIEVHSRVKVKGKQAMEDCGGISSGYRGAQLPCVEFHS